MQAAEATPYEELSDEDRVRVDAQRALWDEDFRLFARERLTVLDRDHPNGSRFISFVFNPLQDALHKTIEKIEEFNLLRTKLANDEDGETEITSYPVHLVILKARKGGCSTYLVGRNFWRGEHHDGHKGLIMAHEKPAAQNIAQIISPFHYAWNDPDGIGTRRQITRITGDLVVWHPRYQSQIITKTAGNKKGSSRSYTYNFLHISEEAHFDASDEVSSALNASVMYAEKYEESTAAGEGNIFYESWRRAISVEDALDRLRTGRPMPPTWNKKFRFFWAWHQDPGYRRALMPGEGALITKTMDEEEKYLVEAYGCTLEQLAWRRDKIAGDCSDQAEMDPLDYFHQEYPSDPDEAFVSKGKTVFAQKRLKSMRDAGEIEMDSGNVEMFRLRRESEGADFSMAVTKNQSAATFFIFERPRPGMQYIMGGDAAEGLSHGDWSTTSVWARCDGQFFEEVARFVGKVGAEELGEIMVWCAKMYNDAFLIPEGRYPGNATCARIINLGYNNIYMRKNPDKVGEQGEPESFFVGFMTAAGKKGNAKALIVELAVRMLRDGKILLRHPEACRQWKIFQQIDGGYGAPEGDNDDMVMSDLFAIFAQFTPAVAPYYDHADERINEAVDKGAYLNDQAAMDQAWHELAKQSRQRWAEKLAAGEIKRAAVQSRALNGFSRRRSLFD